MIQTITSPQSRSTCRSRTPTCARPSRWPSTATPSSKTILAGTRTVATGWVSPIVDGCKADVRCVL